MTQERVTMKPDKDYNPIGVSTEHITTVKASDDLISARQKDMGLSSFFVQGF